MKQLSIPARLLFVCWLSLLILAPACGDDDSPDDDEDPSDDDTSDDDSSPAGDDDNDDASPVVTLYAAAGQAAITPDAVNHPETIHLGGVYPPRLATGVHDDLLAAVLMLQQGDEQVVLVSLDFLGFTRSRGREIQERLAAEGFAKENILIASTHTHEAPDTLGVFGPNLLTSGVSPTYMAFVQDTVVDLVLEVRDRLEPVTMRATKVEIDDPLSNFPTLANDFREPMITVDHLTAAQFISAGGATVATLLNWHAHPEVMIESTEISADFPQWARDRLEERLGGTAVYLSGALGGLATPTGVDVPARDENGAPISDGQGNPVYRQEGTWDKARSLGFVLADLAVDGLAEAEDVSAPELRVVVREMLLPVHNPIMFAGFMIGLLELDKEDIVFDQPDFCGPFGCTSERVGYVRVGPMVLVTSPGETFPETLVGRPRSVVDFGGEWGEFTFPRMRGLEELMDSSVPMHMSVCGNEIGYLIPQSDFHEINHPDWYEEELFLGFDSESIYRRTVGELLAEVGR